MAEPAAPAPGGVPAPGGPRRPRLGAASPPVVTAVVGLLCGAAAGLRLGVPGLVSGLLATGVVLAFFWSGRVPLLLARGSGRWAALLVLLVNYALRLLVVAVVLRLAARAGVVVPRVVGGTVVACALAWTGALVGLLLRTESTG